MRREITYSLNTATSGELFEELSKRCRNCLFISSVDSRCKGDAEVYTLTSGSDSEILGLIKHAEIMVMKCLIPLT